MRKYLINLLAATVLSSSLAGIISAQTRQKVDMGFSSFSRGELESLAINERGILRPAAEFTRYGEADGPVIWNAIHGPDGTLFLGTGNSGIVVEVTAAGESREIFNPGSVLTRALALGPDGALYAGTSPDGRVYRLRPDGEGGWKNAEVFFDPPDGFIWDMIFDEDGSLFVATGQSARVYRLPAGFRSGVDAAEVYFRSAETHFTSLAFDHRGDLILGSGPRGHLYRLTGQGEGFALYHAGVPEIRTLLPMEDGTIYFVAFDTGGARRSRGPERGRGDNNNDEDRNGSAAGEAWRATPFSPSGSQILKLDEDGFVELYWELPEVQIFSLLAEDDGSLLVGTGKDGAVFRVRSRNEWELLNQLPSGGEVSALRRNGDAVYAFTSNPARIYRMTDQPLGGGRFLSAVMDADQIVSWGRFDARSEFGGPIPDSLQVETRTGNTDRPDGTWSAFQSLAEDGRIASPHARYLQYRLTWPDTAGEGETLRAARVFYRLANRSPFISRINLVPMGFELVQGNTPRRNFDLNQLTETSDLRPFLSPQQPRQQLVLDREEAAVTAGWQATDPNGDRLRFRVEMMGPEAGDWVTLADDLADPVYSMSLSGLPEGYYQLRITASDYLDNPPGQERTFSRVSEPFLVDLSPPEISIEHEQKGAGHVVFHITARDTLGVISAARYRLNGGQVQRILPDDGIHDQREERFTIVLKNLETGPHSLVVEAMDENGNLGVRQLRFHVNP